MMYSREFRALLAVMPRTQRERAIEPASLGFKAWLRRAHREGLITSAELATRPAST